jgi:hypothetical protein
VSDRAKPLAGVPDDSFDVALSMLTRERQRGRRKRAVRANTLSLRQLKVQSKYIDRLPTTYWRPSTRGDCANVPRPCPYVSCRYHLFLEATAAGGIKFNFPDLEPDELGESCCLDVADRGGESLERVGAILNITRERVRQIEVSAFARATENPALIDHAERDERELERPTEER